MAYTVPHTWVAGDFLRASWLNLTTTDLVDHEARIVALEATGAGDVVGPSASIASEIALFDGTTGKLLKRATGTGYVKVTSGVMGTPSATVPTSDLSGTVALATQVSGNLPLANLPTTLAQTLKVSIPLTDAQIKALPTTPITIVAAPGAGLFLQFHSAFLDINASAGAYSNVNADAWGVFQVGGEGVSGYLANETTSGLTVMTVLLANAARNIAHIAPRLVSDPGGWGAIGDSYTATAQIDALMRFYVDNAGSGNFTGGNGSNSGRIVVRYSVL